MNFKKSISVLLTVLVCFLMGCTSTEEDSRKKRTKKKRRVKVEAPESARSIASSAKIHIFDKSGLDFLSKKLEDTISGYQGIQTKISELEERLGHLIFLLEGKVHATNARKESEDLVEAEEESSDLPLETEEALLDDIEEDILKDNKPDDSDLPNESIVSKGL